MSGYACSLLASSDDSCFPELQQVVIAAITAKPWMLAYLEQATWDFSAPQEQMHSNIYNVNGLIATATRATTLGTCALNKANSIDLHTFIGLCEILAIASALWSLRNFQYRLCDLSRHRFEPKLIRIFVVFVACLVRVFVAYLTYP